MKASTAKIWAAQHDRYPGDRERLFAAVSDAIDAADVLDPGSYVDITPSFVWPDVTYLDIDRRDAEFFDDTEGVDEIIAGAGRTPTSPQWRFLLADDTAEPDLPDEGFDLLVSLYAGPVSRHCTQHLRVGGWLLANPSHGDVAMASIDDRYRLAGVVRARDGRCSVRTDELDRYLVPKRAREVTVESIERSGRGVAYTVSAFAYLFRRVARAAHDTRMRTMRARAGRMSVHARANERTQPP